MGFFTGVNIREAGKITVGISLLVKPLNCLLSITITSMRISLTPEVDSTQFPLRKILISN
jgi:hypothetical protein